jgi:hypothetical protein
VITSASAVCNCVSAAPTGVTCSTIGSGPSSVGASSVGGSSVAAPTGFTTCVPGSSANCAATASAVPSCAVCLNFYHQSLDELTIPSNHVWLRLPPVLDVEPQITLANAIRLRMRQFPKLLFLASLLHAQLRHSML